MIIDILLFRELMIRDWWPKIEHNISTTTYLVCVVSPAGARQQHHLLCVQVSCLMSQLYGVHQPLYVSWS